GVERVAAVVAGVPAGGRGRPGLEVLRQRRALGGDELLAQQAGAHLAATEADQGAAGLAVEGRLGDAEHGQRVDDPGQHGEDEQAAQGGDVLPDNSWKAVHSGHLNPGTNWTMRSMSLIPANGMSSPPRPYMQRFLRSSADADDGRYLTPRRDSGISAMMISALKMIAE